MNHRLYSEIGSILRKFLAILLNLTAVGALFYFTFATIQQARAAEQKEETLEGTLEVLHQDDFQNNKSKDTYFLKTKDEKLELQFSDKKPAPRPGSKIKVKGNKKDGVLAVGNDGFQVSSQLSVTTPGPKKVAVILINFQNNAIQPYTVVDAKSSIFTAPDSSNAYYKEASFNQLSLEGKEQIEGDVFGWYTIPYDNTDCNYGVWALAARNAAYNDGHDIDVGYTNYVYAFPSPTGCNWSGLTNLLGSELWINTSQTLYLEEFVSHELGHNFGAHHASSYNCLDSNGVRVPISSNCVMDEYGDLFDVMGHSFRSYYHFNNFHKGEVGWFVDTNTQTASESATFNIVPIETSSSAVQALRVPKDRNFAGNPVNYYYVEYRQSFGFDSFSPTSEVVNGVSIRIAPEYDLITQTKLIDTTPETFSFSDAPLTLGRSFTDPEKNITITLTSLTSAAATVQVTMPPSNNTCVRANPTVSVVPDSQTGIPGQTIFYEVAVTNNDTLDCGASSFTIAPVLPLQLTQIPDVFQRTIINPGITDYSQFSITSATDAVDGSLSFEEVAVNDAIPSYTGSGFAQYLVQTIDVTPPQVSLIQPLNGSLVSGVVNVQADASDANGIQKVEFYVDNNLLGTSTSAPYLVNWDTSSLDGNTSHTLVAKAFDIAGNIATSSVTVTTADQKPPTVSIQNPLNNSTVSGITAITASASDDVGVSKVEFYVDNNLLGTSTSAPYFASWDTTGLPSNSQHTISAKAYDSAGNMATSSVITVSISDIINPTVNVSFPVNGSNVSGIVAISVDAADDVGVTMVDFLVDGVLLSRDSTSPFSASWDTTNFVNNSTHTIIAKAYDAASNIGTSSTVTVKVTDIIVPNISITSPANGSTVPKRTTVIITANASDVSGIQKVEFQVNGALKCTDTSAPYSCSWSVPNKPNVLYTLEAKAYDAANNTAVNSIKVTAK